MSVDLGGKERIQRPMMSSVTNPVSLDFMAIDARRSAETAWRAQSVYRETVPVQKVVMSLASAFILTGAIIINTIAIKVHVLMMNTE